MPNNNISLLITCYQVPTHEVVFQRVYGVIMPTHPLLYTPLLPVPVVQVSITITSHNVTLRRGNVRLHRSVEEILMLVLRYWFVHLEIHQMHSCTLLTTHQHLIPIGQKSHRRYRVINDSLNLRNGRGALVDGIHPNTAIRMTRIHDGFHSITSYHLHTLPTTDRVYVGCLLYLPYFNLFIIWTTYALFFGGGPCNPIDFLPMANKWMELFPSGSGENLYTFVSGASQQTFSSII